jgi:rhodanese-related sulfurtransferase
MDARRVERITCEKLKQLLDAKRKPVLVDLRGSGGYAAGHIPGAVNISYDPAADPFERQIKLSALPSDRSIVLYCD